MKIELLKKATILMFITSAFVACQKDDDNKPALRASVNASTFTSTTPYAATFVDANGNTTVDFTSGNNLYKMFQGLNTYINLNKTQTITADVSKNLYSNTGSPFTV